MPESMLSRKATPLRVADLFAGAGGMALGFRAAGCRITTAVEIDEAAAATFRRNFGLLQPGSPPAVRSGDSGNIEQINLADIASPGDIDILVGGPPCQGFSRVGRGKLENPGRAKAHGFADDPRNKLYRRFLDAAEHWRPKAVVMENVTGMLSVAGKNLATKVAGELAECGYRTVFTLLNAARYGIPQLRQRLFFIGLRDDLGRRPSVPSATHRVQLPSGYERRNEPTMPLFVRYEEVVPDLHGAFFDATTVSEALGDLPALTQHLAEAEVRRTRREPDMPYRSGPQSAYAALMRRWPELPPQETVTHNWIHLTPRDWKTFKRMRPGDRYTEALQIARSRLEEHIRDLHPSRRPSTPEEFRALQADFVPPYSEKGFRDKWRKLIPGAPSWTVPAHLAKDSYSHIHYDDDQERAISVREAARLQSFPDAFTFVGNMGDCYRQIGNAVPPLLAWVLATQVVNDLGYSAEPVRWPTAAASPEVPEEQGA